ncbi:MAG: hypothetical protein RLZZ458_108 [Planctomycetota bacterium]
MTESLAEFIQRVENFEIDPGPKEFTFAARLARENHWSLLFAERVIREYKRFCILAVHSGHPVTPSEQVDQAWHLHLTYTRSYWERFCRSTLGQPLHHEPTAGGAAEDLKFEDWYTKTLASYWVFFHERPPTDIWPEPELRFDRSNDWKWYNAKQYWLLPCPSESLLSLLSAVLLLLLFAGCVSLLVVVMPNIVAAMTQTAPSEISSTGWSALCLHAFVSAAVVIHSLLKTMELRKQTAEAGTPIRTTAAAEALSQMSVEDLAVLAGGAHRLAVLSLLRLQSLGCLRLAKRGWLLPRMLEPIPDCQLPTAEVDQVALQSFWRFGSVTKLVQALKPYYDAAIGRQQSAGLRYSSCIRSAGLFYLAFLPLLLCIPLVVGFLHMPVGMLPLAYSGLAAISCLAVNTRTVRLTPSGRWVLQQKHSEAFPGVARVDTHESAHSRPTATEPLMLQIALSGAAFAVMLPEFRETTEMLRTILSDRSAAAGSDCGDGCSADGSSSGGCGGGGGGCGS